jgi:hypothetical protein
VIFSAFTRWVAVIVMIPPVSILAGSFGTYHYLRYFSLGDSDAAQNSSGYLMDHEIIDARQISLF